jgi:hypothetical protein
MYVQPHFSAGVKVGKVVQTLPTQEMNSGWSSYYEVVKGGIVRLDEKNQRIDRFVGQFSIHFENEVEKTNLVPLSGDCRIRIEIDVTGKSSAFWVKAEKMVGNSRTGLVTAGIKSRLNGLVPVDGCDSIEITSIKGEWVIY